MKQCTPSFFLFPIFNLRQVSQIWRGKRNVSLWLLNVFRGAGVSGRQTEKKQVNLKAGLLILPEEVCTPRVEPREALEREHSLPNKSNNLPLSYQQFSKARFSGAGAVPSPPPSPPSYRCHLSSLHGSYWFPSKWRSNSEIPHFSFQPPEATQLQPEEEELGKGTSTWVSKTVFSSLVPDLQNYSDLIPRFKRHQGT